jgi:hypothetical protein
MCNKINHKLIEIWRVGYVDQPNVVVCWCEDCGAVVVDGEYDNRIYAGKYMPMKFPKEIKQ